MSDSVIAQIIGRIKEEGEIIAADAMRFPKGDPFEHGVTVGTWQGVNIALQVINEVLRGEAEEESR